MFRVASRLNTVSLNAFTTGVVIFCLVWLFAAALARVLSVKRDERIMTYWRRFNFAAACVCLVMILCMTIIGRQRFPERLLLLRPFNNIVKAFTYVEYRREKLLNLYMFIPFGLTLSCAAACRDNERKGKRFFSLGGCPTWGIILAGFSLTFLIELTQGIFILGTAETDDIITNTAGTFIGLQVWHMAELLASRYLKRSGSN